MKNNILKILLWAFVIIYVVSPIDAVPGPVDDLLLMIISYYVNSGVLVEKY